jgi:hypothetical protein
MAFDPTNLNFKKQLSSLIGFDKFGIDQMRSVEWGRKYLWAIKFLDTNVELPTVFKDYFPASDVEFPVGSLDSFGFDLAQSSYKVPQRSQIKQMSVTFFDDINGSLLKWFRDWIEIDILNFGQFISCINDEHHILEEQSGQTTDSFGAERKVSPVRTIQIDQLKPDLEPTGLSYILKIYPEGEINFTGASASEATTYTVNFVIVGENRPPVSAKKSNTDKLKDLGVKTLGRFL